MSTEITKTEPKKGEIIFTPYGENEKITLTVATVKSFIAAKTKSGKLPTDAEIIKFMMLCQARQLNPWVGDAYLVGYDGRDGATFSLITAKQALDKRAELHPQYNGIESGLIMLVDGSVEQIEGVFCMDEEKIVGAWATVWRKDIDRPYKCTVKLNTYSTGRSRWAKDPAGMIVKVAEAAALRKSFPTQIGGLYVAEEMEAKERNITPKTESGGSSTPGPLLDQGNQEPLPLDSIEVETVDETEPAKPKEKLAVVALGKEHKEKVEKEEEAMAKKDMLTDIVARLGDENIKLDVFTELLVIKELLPKGKKLSTQDYETVSAVYNQMEDLIMEVPV